jgi:glycerol-3-phosphate acyltransferase PlsY
MIDALVYFFRDVLIGDPVIFGVMILITMLLFLFLSRTSLEQITTFMILPIYALNQSGYLAGAIAGSLWALIAILAGFVFFKNIRNIMGG